MAIKSREARQKETKKERKIEIEKERKRHK